jgi:hypothetical protein
MKSPDAPRPSGQANPIPVPSIASKKAGLTLNDPFLNAYVRGKTWQTAYSDDWYKDSLVFSASDQSVQKSPGTKYHQAATWSVQPDGRTLRVDMTSGGFYMLITFTGNASGDIEFHRGTAPILAGKVTRDGAESAPQIPQAPVSPTASNTLWIDNKGRSIAATFLRISNSDVLLNINGKPTPVPLASLSTTSQQLASQLGFQAMLKNESWLPGSWQLKGGDNETANLDFLPHHIAIQLGSFHYDMGGWALVNDVLTIKWQGNKTQVIKLCLGNDGKALSASVSENSGAASLNILSKTADLVTVDSPDAKELEGVHFKFAWRNTNNPSRSKFESNRSLASGGKAESTDRAFVTWKIRGNKLVLLNAKGQDETIYGKFFKLGARWVIEGNFLYWKGEITHVLMQLP